MGIAQKVARNFSDAVRSRGQSYFVKGRVTLMTARAGEVVARVRGTSKYRVRVRLRGSKLLASCTCPYFNPQREPCKHLWATLLLAEARGLLHSPPVFPVHLVTEESPRQAMHEGLPDPRTSPRLDQQSTELGELDLGLEMMGLVPARPVGPNIRGSKSKRKDRQVHGSQTDEQGSWSQRSRTSREYPGPGSRSKIKSAAAGPNTGPAKPRAINRNAKRLLVYVLDVSATLCKIKWSSIWLVANVKRQASGGLCALGITHRMLPM